MSNQVSTQRSALTMEEKEFIASWEKVREKERRWTYHLRHNFPGGVIFGVPIALFFFIEAPRHRGLITHTDLILIMAGIVLIVIFYAILKGYIRYDQKESHYQILKMKEGNQASNTALPGE